ncbi:IS110 family transposase [Auritidibacter sp. NML130574]|uniref:IS110 family transposase n=1 Tax=Auritidibacter sp. NML130574 TaxID=2170745 RepID=UPI000D727BCD|nr:transposase [Auritidibacter sp. NML130574]AXR74701.1 IS110 family transposase [Auritidibacter sp. NML130574]
MGVGKFDHRAAAVDHNGKVIYDKPLPRSDPKIQALLKDHRSQHGELLVVVNQSKTIGALLIAVAQQLGIHVVYLSGRTMPRVADLLPGQASTGDRGADIIVEVACLMPHTFPGVTVAEEQFAEQLSMLCGFDDDLVAQLSLVHNRLPGLLAQSPCLERIITPRVVHLVVVDLLDRYSTPASL